MKQVIGDLRSRESVQGAVSGCRAVFHVAALYRFWAHDPEAFYAINVEGTRNVLGAATDEGVERLVYTSTVGTLGLERVSAPAPPTSARSPMCAICTAPTSARSTWPNTRCSRHRRGPAGLAGSSDLPGGPG